MPDIKTALTQALARSEASTLQAWEEDEELIRQPKPVETKEEVMKKKKQNGLALDAFNLVLECPNQTVDYYADRLVHGYDYPRDSSRATIYAHARHGLIRRQRDDSFVAQVAEYLTPSEMRAMYPKLIPDHGIPDGKGITALKVGTKVEIIPVKEEKEGKPIVVWTPESLVDGLTLKQARVVYDYLDSFFGTRGKV
jgi:hypothetical protein